MIARSAALAIAAAAALLSFAPAAAAQSPPAAPFAIPVGDFQLTPTLDVRTRGEYRRDPVDLGGLDEVGLVSPRVRDAVTVLTRARVGLGAERGPLRAQVTLQDVRAWGAASAFPSPGAVSSTPLFTAFGAYEAYAEVHVVSPQGAIQGARPTRQTFVRLGRQAVRWGDGLLIGTADWSPAGRSLDAVRALWVVGNWDVELLAAMLAAPRPVVPGSGDTAGPFSPGAQLYGAHGAWSVDPLLKLELTALARVASSPAAPTTSSRFAAARAEGETYTASVRVSGDRGVFEYGLEGAGQLGSSNALRALDPRFDGGRAAFAAAGHVSVRFEALPSAPTLRLGGSYASGEGSGATYGQFDPILADVHTHFGAMDVFALSNLLEAHARVTIAPFDELRASIEYRYARLATRKGEWLNAYLASVGELDAGKPVTDDATLGHEVDAVVTWQPFAPFELHGGYSILALGDGGRAILARQQRGRLEADGSFTAAHLAHVAYVQATLRVP